MRDISTNSNLLYVDEYHAKRLVRKAVLVGSFAILLVGTTGLIAAFYGNENPADVSGTESSFGEFAILTLASTISCVALTSAAAYHILGKIYRNSFIQIFDQAIIVNYRTIKIIPLESGNSIQLFRDDLTKKWRIRSVVLDIKSLELPISAFPRLDEFLKNTCSAAKEDKNKGRESKTPDPL